MNRKNPSVSQLMAWSVPLLLILLLIQTNPQIVTLVRDHFLSPPTTQPAHPLTHVTAPGIVRKTTTPTSSGPPSSSTTVPTNAVNESANSPNAVETTQRGDFVPPDNSIVIDVPANSTWNVFGEGNLQWQLVCNSTVISSQASPVVVPPNATSCAVQIQSLSPTSVSWVMQKVN